MGLYEIKKSVSSLLQFKAEMQINEKIKTASHQLAKVCNRMFVTLEGKGILRASTEEFMLASQHKSHDPLAGEFIRTFRHANFYGKAFLTTYEETQKAPGVRTMETLLSHRKEQPVPHQSLYGMRCNHPDLFFLSPWEFFNKKFLFPWKRAV